MSLDFVLSHEQQAFRDLARTVASDSIAGAAATGPAGVGDPLPSSERRRLADLGFLGICLPEEYGGAARPLLDALIVLEELAKESQLAAFQIFEANTGPARVVDLFGNADQKARLLPPIIAGEKTMAVAISEPEAGSAATDLTTRARKDGHAYIINGVKRWCSGAGHAEQYLIYARLTDEPGAKAIGALVVDSDTPGISLGPPERLMGFEGIPSADIFLDDVRVPATNLIVDAGGFGRLFTAFSIERLGNATMSLAIGQASLDRTVRYVQERRQFGKALVEFQMIQSALADMIMQVEAARLLIYRAAQAAGRQAPTPLEASLAKCFANEMALRVSDLAMMAHGGYGYSLEYGIERLHRDAHGWAIAGGTPDMQRIRIVSEYLGRRFDQRG